MRKILIAFIAAASIGAMSVATSSKAEAWWGWWGPGAVVGAFVGGAVVGSAIATRPVLPASLLLRTVPLLRTTLPQRLERLRLGARLLVSEKPVAPPAPPQIFCGARRSRSRRAPRAFLTRGEGSADKRG